MVVGVAVAVALADFRAEVAALVEAEAAEAGKILIFKEQKTIHSQLIAGAWDLDFISPNLSRCLHPHLV